MYMIPCSDDCVYQKDGYCSLDIPAQVNNVTKKHCIHYIKIYHDKSYQNNININDNSYKTK